MKEIKLTNGKVAIVDDEDFDFLNQWKWNCHTISTGKNSYAIRTVRYDGKKTSISMHRVLLERYNKLDEKFIDHIDRNGLNNQKSNLRHATFAQNCINAAAYGKSKYKGVDIKKIKSYTYFRARIKFNKKSIHIGLFNDEKTAAEAYNKAAIKYYGEYAYLNIIQD